MSDNGIEVSGTDNIVAGRDITVLIPERISEALLKHLKTVDDRINAMLPEGLLSYRRKNEFANPIAEPFSSQKLIQSLGVLGIPIDASLDILVNVESNIKFHIDLSSGDITTREVRKAISDAIFALDSIIGGVTSQEWGGRYARKYGNPDERLKVLLASGVIEHLDFKFLKKTLIPHLIETILDTKLSQIPQNIITGKAIQSMAEEIHENVQRLNLYTISYNTLFNFARDLATQPPHPWLVEPETILRTVNYDLERSKSHLDRIQKFNIANDFAAYWHSCCECLHHASSALLANYGGFLGGSYLSPLFSLTQAIKFSKSTDNLALWEYCRIKNLPSDLRSQGYDTDTVLRLLAKAQAHLNGRTPKNLEHLAGYAPKLYEISELLPGIRTQT